MNIDFWKGRRCLITGHSGFKGGWLAAWLKLIGADVYGYALEPNTNPSFFEEYKLKYKISQRCGDVRDYTFLNDYIDMIQPSIIFHLAAQPLVRYSYKYPLTTLETNIMGTANLLTAVKNHSNIKAVIVVTSDKCYLSTNKLSGYNEEDPLGGNDPYSASKAGQEIITKSYIESFFKYSDTAVATVRAGNVIGGGDYSEDRLLPDIIRTIQYNRTLLLRYPNAVRPWQHVLEPLHGYIMLAEKLAKEGQVWGGAWNFGPNYPMLTVGELTTKIFELVGSGIWIYDKPLETLKETDYLTLDCNKSNTTLNWNTKLPLDECIKWTVDWYKKCNVKQDMVIITNNQITNYMSLLGID